MANNKTHKQDGTLKKKYKDMPRFKAIYGYEDQFKSDAKKTIDMAIKQIFKTANKFVKQNNE